MPEWKNAPTEGEEEVTMNSSTGPKRSIGSKIALVTAFVFILGGGTAFGAFVVSSNSQIGPNTVSGHKPPAGKHANIIGGSVNATDLANGSVNNGKLAPGAVSTAKIGRIPQARAEFTADQNITNNTFTNLCFDTTAFDNDHLWDATGACGATGAKTKLVAPVAGVYQVDAAVQWANDSTGVRVLRLTKNGTSDLVTDQRTAAAFTGNTASTLVKLGAGGFVQAEVLQNSGGTLAALGVPTTNLAMTWVGKG
jgi:hypothetical protein